MALAFQHQMLQILERPLSNSMKTFPFALLTLFLITACSEKPSEQAQSKEKISPHSFFTSNHSRNAFSVPMKHLNNAEEDLFILGKSFFSIPWVESPASTTARDGLGPLFSANTCKHCHPRNGAGLALTQNNEMSRSLLLRFSHKTSTNQMLLNKNGFEPDSMYGSQLSQNGNHNVPAEGIPNVRYTEIIGHYADGESYLLRKPTYVINNLNYGALDSQTVVAPRIGSALIGLGLLENISEKDILKYQDIKDTNNDGISGKANYAFDPESNRTKLGRFTWKASATSVKHQSAAAAHNDMGLSNPLFPLHNCSEKQLACLKEAQNEEQTFDLPQKRLDAITFYLSHLAIPKPREVIQENVQSYKKGKSLFTALNCISCHVADYTTVKAVTISPYSDLLLHDMGEGLADGRSEFLANGSEWRTAPLWGIGLYQRVSGEANFLHDGRARSIEEAILWHGGEAQKSKEQFMQLSKKERQSLRLFLETI
ncbi:MAG: Probable thiol oxidoreductase with 2 cytochrome c heme-binding sites [uncultured Sulfurovum sp.]|uniref:Probable thiol oxidoreductase with 2 cytochrome c heme-binding sites n=1 Tax=uncultured Sulfurovum sp. TaxID=269237 RepID=A0A6S6TD90_9BACT|nr:MAG: Probable thiol oxidoreductase with 2 cytochrome c heme-binding sites [uncultured Sulfurovum sp.]